MSENLPKSDDVLERHQFYASLGSSFKSLEDNFVRSRSSIDRVHMRMDAIQEAQTNLHEKHTTTETRNRTLAQSVVVAWLVISGVFGWLWDKSSTKVEAYISKIEKLETMVNDLEKERSKMVETNAKINAIGREIKMIAEESTKHNDNKELHKISKNK